ncbi:hypothetical protein E1B28_004405 [Marasmius oreades]|uniref:SLS1 C-terminal domain-containing protein n=1 Tax=Marasmius oreades TaxID=181124 RepID=A0A9P7UYK8_9AGAR|nr:uncharacterized protein E1B28_004405 [Marasmius oreades]KAG7097012.1 hypothetical protein E1B28_004405 [Marasmius oreades]
MPFVPGSSSSSTSFDIPTDPLQSVPKLKKTKRAPKPPSRNLLEDTKVEEYLAEIAASRHIVTLADLTRLRPDRHSDPITPQYEVEYNNLLDRVQQAFNKKQLIHFVDLLGISRPKQRTKSAFAVQVIEQGWGWPSLTVVQKRRRDWSEVETEFFPLNPPQSFLFLGKDGSDLLEFSTEYNVHVAFSSKPLGLKVEGLRGALDHVRSHVATLKEDIEEDFLTLPPNNTPNITLLQRVSRISSAFAENFGSNEIRISYKRSNPRSALVAKRLVTQASCLTSEDMQPSILTYVPPGVASSTATPMSLFPHSYALYPFLSTRTIPWLLDAKGAFRLRGVGEWIGVEATEDIDKTGGLVLGRGRLIDLEENVKDLRQLLKTLFKGDSAYTRESYASMGHILFPSPQPTILPPLKGSWPLGKGLNWISSHRARHIFTTSLPAALLETLPGNRSIIHRLVYQALPTVTPLQENRNPFPKVIKFEMTLSLPSASPPPPRTLSDESGVEPSETKGEEQEIPSFPRQCFLGSEAAIDLMLPDRPMDIRFSAAEFRAIQDVDWPRELGAYADAVTSFLNFSDSQAQQPDTPLTLQYGKNTFMLRSSSNVRQNQEIIDIPGSDPIRAKTESVLDLEANQKTTRCQLTCQDILSDDEWREFLRGCDYLSSFPRIKKAHDLLD